MDSRNASVGHGEYGISIQSRIRSPYHADEIVQAKRSMAGYRSWFAEDRADQGKISRHRKCEVPRPEAQGAIASLRQYVETDPQKVGGVPVVAGTRVPVSQLLAEIADGHSLPDIAEDLDLDLANLQNILRGLAAFLNRPVSR